MTRLRLSVRSLSTNTTDLLSVWAACPLCVGLSLGRPRQAPPPRLTLDLEPGNSTLLLQGPVRRSFRQERLHTRSQHFAFSYMAVSYYIRISVVVQLVTRAILSSEGAGIRHLLTTRA